MRTHSTQLVALLAVAAGLLGACGDSTNNNPDFANNGFFCVANDKTCANDRVAVSCASDGASVITIQCSASETCTLGACVAKSEGISCTSASNGCENATTALRCSAGGKGFDTVACPTGTACVGAGLCEGACIVGSAICTDANTVATCLDGKTYTSVACGAGEACVSTGSSPASAACKPADCTPNSDGCDTVYGNKVDTAAANQAGFVSTCTETPNGYKWTATSCLAPKTCSPSATSCGGGKHQAGCATECTPGDQRCTSLAGTVTGDFGTGYETCGADGKWATAVTACNVSPTALAYICFPNRANAGKVVCGDIACDFDVGGCDATGLFHACDAMGRISASGAACEGICLSSGGFGGGTLEPGHCVAECSPGDERCTNGNSGTTYQVCGTNKRWGAVAACAGSNFCFNTQSATGQPRKVCGVCEPGSVRCSDSEGTSAGNGAAYVQTCQADGSYAAPVACTVGSCNNDGTDASCQAECFPGTSVCIGGVVGVIGSVYEGTAEVGTCSASAKRPLPGTGTACDGGKFCRIGAGGGALGCTVCIGTANNFGLPDTRCASDAVTPSISTVQSCLPDGSAWNTAVLACGGGNPTCYNPSTTVSPPTVLGSYCHSGYGFDELTQSATSSIPGRSCGWYIDDNSTSSCPSRHGGTVGDCCASYCYADDAPTSAFCGPTPQNN